MRPEDPAANKGLSEGLEPHPQRAQEGSKADQQARNSPFLSDFGGRRDDGWTCRDADRNLEVMRLGTKDQHDEERLTKEGKGRSSELETQAQLGSLIEKELARMSGMIGDLDKQKEDGKKQRLLSQRLTQGLTQRLSQAATGSAPLGMLEQKANIIAEGIDTAEDRAAGQHRLGGVIGKEPAPAKRIAEGVDLMHTEEDGPLPGAKGQQGRKRQLAGQSRQENGGEVDRKKRGPPGLKQGQGRRRTEAEVRQSIQAGRKSTAAQRGGKFDPAGMKEEIAIWKAWREEESSTPAMSDGKPDGAGGSNEPILTTTSPKGGNLETNEVRDKEASEEGTVGGRTRKRGLEDEGHAAQLTATKDRRNEEGQDRPERSGTGAKSVPANGEEERKDLMMKLFHEGKQGSGGKGGRKKARKQGRASKQADSTTTSAATATTPTATGASGPAKIGTPAKEDEVEEQVKLASNTSDTPTRQATGSGASPRVSDLEDPAHSECVPSPATHSRPELTQFAVAGADTGDGKGQSPEEHEGKADSNHTTGEGTADLGGDEKDGAESDNTVLLTTVEIRCGEDTLDWDFEASTTAEELISCLKIEAERLVGVANPALPYLLRLNNLSAGAEAQLTMEDAVVTGKILDIPGVVEAGLTLHAPCDPSGQVADGSLARKEASDGEQQEVEIPETVILEHPAGATGELIAHQPVDASDQGSVKGSGPEPKEKADNKDKKKDPGSSGGPPEAPGDKAGSGPNEPSLPKAEQKGRTSAVTIFVMRDRAGYVVDVFRETTDRDVMGEGTDDKGLRGHDCELQRSSRPGSSRGAHRSDHADPRWEAGASSGAWRGAERFHGSDRHGGNGLRKRAPDSRKGPHVHSGRREGVGHRDPREEGRAGPGTGAVGTGKGTGGVGHGRGGGRSGRGDSGDTEQDTLHDRRFIGAR